MPLVKIELAKGRNNETLLKLKGFGNAFPDLVEALELPDDDRNIRLIEYEPEFFSMKNPYEILIEITLFSGRTKETKEEIISNNRSKIINNPYRKRKRIYHFERTTLRKLGCSWWNQLMK